MSAAVSRYIRHVLDGREDLSSTARHLLEVLGHVANADGISYWSVGALAKRTGYGRADTDDAGRMTVRRARRELVEAGLIRFVESRGRGNHNLYALPITEHWCHLCESENLTPTRENLTPTRENLTRVSGTRIHEGSIEAARVTVANGFGVDAEFHPPDPEIINGIMRAVREGRFDDIPTVDD